MISQRDTSNQGHLLEAVDKAYVHTLTEIFQNRHRDPTFTEAKLDLALDDAKTVWQENRKKVEI